MTFYQFLCNFHKLIFKDFAQSLVKVTVEICTNFYSGLLKNCLRFSSSKVSFFAAFNPKSFSISANFFENFLKNLLKISIKLYLKIVQTLVIVYPKIPENFLFFLEFPQIFIKIVSHQHFHNQLIKINFPWNFPTFSWSFLNFFFRNIQIFKLIIGEK